MLCSSKVFLGLHAYCQIVFQNSFSSLHHSCRIVPVSPKVVIHFQYINQESSASLWIFFFFLVLSGNSARLNFVKESSEVMFVCVWELLHRLLDQFSYQLA